MSRFRLLAMTGAVALSLSACSGSSDTENSSPSGSRPTGKVTLNVYAAASLTESFGELEKTYEKENPGVDVVVNFAGSQDLVDQMSGGAPADVLATANTSTMEKAADGGLVGRPVVFASNTLVLVTPRGNPAGVTGLDSSLDGAKLVICAPEVPCGSATVELAAKLGVTLKPVSEEQKVTDVRGKVVSGEADAGIVYRTDALAAGKGVDTVEIPGADQVVNDYPIAIAESSKHRDAGKKFVDLVRSEKGRKTLTKYGFDAAKRTAGDAGARG